MADDVKVAGIFTLPVDQQWISRIHIALDAAKERGDIEYVYSENVSNTDYERVMREYAESGVNLIVGEVFGLERAARKVAADYPETAFLMGSSFAPEAPNFSVFDNFIYSRRKFFKFNLCPFFSYGWKLKMTRRLQKSYGLKVVLKFCQVLI